MASLRFKGVIRSFVLILVLLAVSVSTGAQAADTTAAPLVVALGGNAYVTTRGSNATELISNDTGLMEWTDPGSVISTYVRVTQPGRLSLNIKANLPLGDVSTVRIKVLGKSFNVKLPAVVGLRSKLPTVEVEHPGYVRIDLQGISKTGLLFGNVTAIEVSGSAATGLVYANDPANYYWSRRGPSVHFNFTTPNNTEYIYSEVTIPVGEDAIGSFFMVNGFTSGYMGIQVNSPTERRVLLSVWDPDVGSDLTTLVSKGRHVFSEKFGGEGTGGHAWLVYPWVAGKTYKLITRVRPDLANAGASLFSGWFFAPEDSHWHFIATWRRPNTTTYVDNFNAFAENFNGDYGYLSRKMLHGNEWAVSSTGDWVEVTSARYADDLTGDNKQRMDYAGGIEGRKFFLRLDGFFDKTVPSPQTFQRAPRGAHPTIDLNALPGNGANRLVDSSLVEVDPVAPVAPGYTLYLPVVSK